MSNPIRITVLVENSVHRQGLAAEHGLSVHIQSGTHSLLFDTGQTDLLAQNARALGIRLDSVEAVVLSHGHYDHTGGLPVVLGAARDARVYAHPAALNSKYSRRPGGESRFIGMGAKSIQSIRGATHGLAETNGWTGIVEGIFATGEIPRQSGYEDTGGPFYLDATGAQPDPLRDDQALVIDLGQSLVLLLGCAHAGVVNTMNHVQRWSGGKPIRAVIGGFHLGSASEDRLGQTISFLSEQHIECLAPAHCTGWPATAKLWQALPAAFQSAGVGGVFEFALD